MNYITFKARNDSKRNNSNYISGRLFNISISTNTCSIKLANGTVRNTTISDVVSNVLSGAIYLSNPSSLSNYNFDKYFGGSKKHKDVVRNKKQSEVELDTTSRDIRSRLKSLSLPLLYHGSIQGISGDIDCFRNRGLCDFGVGFYTGECLEQAENRVCNCSNPIIYAYNYNFNGYSVYEFEDIVLWALFVGYNRRVITNISKKLANKFDNINSHDIIIGYIADDKIARSYNDFLEGNITAECLAECLSLIKYGRQFVFKNNNVANSCLIKRGEYVLSTGMRNESLSWGTSMKANMDTQIDRIKIAYQGKGRYFNQCLKEYN